MAKTKTRERSGETPPKSASTSPSSTFDPTLAALFASSSGPVTLPPRPVRSYKKPAKAVANTDTVTATATKPDEVVEEAGSDAESEVSSVNEEEPSSESESEVALEKSNKRPRKRRRVDANDDLESKYLNKLVREEEQEQRQRLGMEERRRRRYARAGHQNERCESGWRMRTSQYIPIRRPVPSCVLREEVVGALLQLSRGHNRRAALGCRLQLACWIGRRTRQEICTQRRGDIRHLPGT